LAHEPGTKPLDEKAFDMAENDVAMIPADPKAVMTQVLIEVSDGQSSAKDFAEISNGNVNQSAATAAAKRTWDVTLASGGTTVITTRNLPVTFVGQ
jgi:Flp pilus assembly protein TadG